jgi:hypothetical protein
VAWLGALPFVVGIFGGETKALGVTFRKEITPNTLPPNLNFTFNLTSTTHQHKHHNCLPQFSLALNTFSALRAPALSPSPSPKTYAPSLAPQIILLKRKSNPKPTNSLSIC